VIEMASSAGLLLLLDQWSKRIAQVHARDSCISWGPLLRIRYVANLQAIYSRQGARAGLVLVWGAAVVSAIALHGSGAWFQSSSALIGLGSALGGRRVNKMEILRRRGVGDFIDLTWWPVFNLADVAIVAGLTMAFWPQS